MRARLVGSLLLLIKLSLFELTVFFCLCCQQPVSQNQAIIKGDLNDASSFLEGKELYLINLETNSPEDTSLVRKGKFQFTVDATKDFTTHRVKIEYRTGNAAWPYLPIGIINPFLKNTYESSFYLEKGTTQIKKDASFKPGGMAKVSFSLVNIKPQTEVAYKHLSFKLGRNLSLSQKQYNSELVGHHPYSLDLLNSLYSNRNVANQAELARLLSLFDQSLQNTLQYKNLLFYIGYRSENDTVFPTKIRLKNPDRDVALFVPDSTKYNLIVFWASWCGPCRMEIPQIKALYATQKSKLVITSISVDKKEDSWLRALQQEKMPWRQFLVDGDSSMVKLDKKYNLTAIPVWLLLDSKNKLLDQQVGVSLGKNAIDRRIAAQIAK